jgi:pyruvate/2-oxoglutarate dehydrogenase complex dihydrolipoamide acyltransferase (E2) component
LGFAVFLCSAKTARTPVAVAAEIGDMASSTHLIIFAGLLLAMLMVTFRPSSSMSSRRMEQRWSAVEVQRHWQARWAVGAPPSVVSTAAHSAAATAPPPATATTAAATAATAAAATATATATATEEGAAAALHQSAEAERAIQIALAEPIPPRGDGRRGGLDHEANMRKESDTVRKIPAEVCRSGGPIRQSCHRRRRWARR